MPPREPFNRGDDPIPNRLRPIMNDIGHMVGGAIDDAVGGPGKVGFILFTFDFGDVGTMSYISNANRDDALSALAEFITRNAHA